MLLRVVVVVVFVIGKRIGEEVRNGGRGAVSKAALVVA